MPINHNDREYRNMLIRSADEVEGQIVKGYATTYNEPYELYRTNGYIVREQVDSHAFDECDVSDVIMQYDHAGRVFARTSNNTLTLENDEHGLGIIADLGHTQIGRDLYEEIKGGYTTKMSFGFTVTGEAWEEFEENGAIVEQRTITKIGKLYDVSAVSLPANDATEISARNLCDGVIKKIEAERLEAQRTKEARERLELRLKILEG